MAVSSKHILQQGPVLAGIGRTALAAIQQQLHGVSKTPVHTPGPVLKRTLPPRERDLVKDYVRHVGGDRSEYKKTLPPHMFPQWGFGLASQTLAGIPYPLFKVMNGGCRLEVNAPLPQGEPLEVTAQLVSIDDNGRRAVMHQRIVTGTKSSPEAIVGNLYAIVPLGGGKKKGGPKKEKPRVPETAREVGRWKIRSDAGLDFAKLTGDFNPLHWVGPYAKASGFKNTILHGFSTMARAYEGLNRGLFKGSRQITVFDVQFTRPLVLPARVGLFTNGENEVMVGAANEGPAYMIGKYETREKN